MLIKHFSSRLSIPAILTVFLAVITCFGMPRTALEAQELETGGYTFDAGETFEGAKIFISEDPATDQILFESGAEIDAEIPYEPIQWAKDFEQWRLWHRETGADPDRIGEYDLAPLAAFTMGRTYDRIILEEGARIVNRGDVGDGMKTMGSVDVDVGPNAVIHGDWSAISFGNFENPGNDDFFKVSINNQGTIGTFIEDFGFEPFEMTSQQGLVFYEGVEGTVINEESGVIKGEHAGIYTHYKVGEDTEDSIYTDPYYRGEDPGFAEDRSFHLENRGEITGGFYGIYEGGGLENVNIVNSEEGVIDGGSVGIYLGRGGTLENRGTISGEDVGIFVARGTADISHFGTLAVSGDEAADAIRFSRQAVGGQITLYNSLGGSILHIGEAEDAALYLESPLAEEKKNDPLTVGNIAIGEGIITQRGGTWFYKEILAHQILLEGGEMHLDRDVELGSRFEFESGSMVSENSRIEVKSDAALSITGGVITTGDFINRGILNFSDGEITIEGGVFDYAEQDGARDLRIAGAEPGQNPHLRFKAGASTTGIDALAIGGEHAGTLSLESNFLTDKAMISVGNGLSVHSNGLLAGLGTVNGDVAVHDGGTIRPEYSKTSFFPGESTDSLRIDGDFEINDGAVLDIGVDRDEQDNAKIDVSGDVFIGGNAGVTVTDYSRFTLRDGSEYTFLNAGGSLEGEFSYIESFSPVYEFEPFYDAGSASFRVIRLANYSDYVGQGEKYHTKNRDSYVAALESAWEAEHLEDMQYSMDWLLGRVLMDRAPVLDLIETIDQLNPEPYQAGCRMAGDQAIQMTRRFLRGARTSRFQIGTGSETQARILPGQIGESKSNSGMRVFYGGYRRVGDIEASPARTGHTYKLRGGYIGVDRTRREGLLAGFGLGYADGRAAFENGGVMEMKTLRIGPHATIDKGSLELDVALNLGWHPVRQKRNMPHINRQSVARYNIWDGSVYTGARYNLSFLDQWLLAPSASLQYIHQYRESFKERRAGDARLKMDAEFNEILRSMLGLQFSREFRTSRFVLVPELFGGWEYDLLDHDMTIEAEFAEAPGSKFRVDADGPGKDALVYGGGLTVLFGEYNVAFATYELEEKDHGDGYTFSAGVKWNF